MDLKSNFLLIVVLYKSNYIYSYTPVSYTHLVSESSQLRRQVGIIGKHWNKKCVNATMDGKI